HMPCASRPARAKRAATAPVWTRCASAGAARWPSCAGARATAASTASCSGPIRWTRRNDVNCGWRCSAARLPPARHRWQDRRSLERAFDVQTHPRRHRPALPARETPQRLHLLISLASILGIALGVAALITTLAVMSGFQKEIRDRMLGMAAHATVTGYGEPLQEWRHAVQTAMTDPRVVGAAPYIEKEALISGANNQPA